MTTLSEFDAIVVGSGITGGWAAKELCEQGLKVLLLERGRAISPEKDYTDMLAPWETKHLDIVPQEEVRRKFSVFEREVKNFGIAPTYSSLLESSKHFWCATNKESYVTPANKPYSWFRGGYHLGGRSVMWGRQCHRWNEQDFEHNKLDGYGVDWPIRYADLAPWYTHVEKFAGVSGTICNLPSIPDGHYQPPFDLNVAEKIAKKRIEATFSTRNVIIGRSAHLTQPTEEQIDLGRSRCQARRRCLSSHGCIFRSDFSSLTATLPAAEKTGNLTTVTDAIVESLNYDPKAKRVSGVRVLDARTNNVRTYHGRIVFLCASAIPSAMILLNSVSESFPNGLANTSDQVGRNLMDHVCGHDTISGTMPGNLDRYYKGRRPTGIIIPQYANFTEFGKPYLRGFAFQGQAYRSGIDANRPGVGAKLKQANRTPGPWKISISPFGEVLPNPNNRVTLHNTRKDKWGMPIPMINAVNGKNEQAMMQDAYKDAVAMLKAAGCVDISNSDVQLKPPGSFIHEMGTARMGRSPETSVLNGWNQAHDVPNLFITDGACMTSSGVYAPSLTYMAITARAANYAAKLVKSGTL